MSKKVKVTQIQPDPPNGPVFGPASNPADFTKSQIFAHEHAEKNARDFIVGKCFTRAVAGFEHSLPGGMVFRINAPGQVVGTDGKSYELISAAPVDAPLAAAHATLPRADLVVAVLDADADAAPELRPFRRIRTLDELEENIAAYPPEQFNTATEQHTKATILVKTGVPANEAAPPVAAANEEPLYQIIVPAASTQILTANVIDLRNLVASNCELQDRIRDVNEKIINNPPRPHRHFADESDIATGSPARQLGATTQDALDTLALALKPPAVSEKKIGAVLRPAILRPDLANDHASNGKLGSAGSLEGGVPSVRIPYPRETKFYNGVFVIEPNSFVDQALNPRIINADPDAANSSDDNQVNYSLNVVEVVQTDGGGDFELKGFQLPTERVRSYAGGRLAAARDGRHIEVMGGNPLGGDSSWYTIDTVQGTVTQRNFTGVYPQFFIRGVFPCGDGKVLVAEQPGADGGVNGGRLKWYLVDAADPNGLSAEIPNGPGSGAQEASSNPSAVVGDLIAPGIVLVIINATGVSQGTMWAYDVAENSFEQINPLGPNPLAGFQLNKILEHVDMCCYKQGQAVLVRGINPATFIFDYPSRTWIPLQIPQPSADLVEAFGSTLWGVTLANFQGRVILTSETSSTWELTPASATSPVWTRVPTLVAPRGHNGLAALLEGGLPKGKGFLIGGRTTNQPKKDIWAYKAAGVVETVFEGNQALTLGPNTKSATIKVTNYNTLWKVGRYLITLRGKNLQGRASVSASFDNGGNFQAFPVNESTVVEDSLVAPSRQLLITLSGTENVKPVLQTSTELFEKFGAGSSQGMLYVVYDAPVAVRYLYIDDKGKITLEAAAAHTTETKCLLHKVTPNGALAPALFDYKNRSPRIQQKWEGNKGAGADPVIAFDWAVMPDYIEAWKIDVNGFTKLLADVGVVFNGNITVLGLAANEGYRVILGG